MMGAEIVNQIRTVWEYEQRILDVFHNICVSNNLKYSLAYGTLLGAVRHAGFIPWDDDIDVTMPRNDYERLLDIWKESAPSDYILVNHELYPDFTQNFSKIVLNNTTFLQSEELGKVSYPKGIFIDIFPCDRVPTNFFSVKTQYLAAMVNMLYTRDYTSEKKGITTIIEKFLLCFPRAIKNYIKKNTKVYIQKWNMHENLKYFSPVTLFACKRTFSSQFFDRLIKIKFNDAEYCCSHIADEYLTEYYGDYMQLPPEGERTWKHHPVLIDFEHNYEDIQRHI